MKGTTVPFGTTTSIVQPLRPHQLNPEGHDNAQLGTGRLEGACANCHLTWIRMRSASLWLHGSKWFRQGNKPCTVQRSPRHLRRQVRQWRSRKGRLHGGEV